MMSDKYLSSLEVWSLFLSVEDMNDSLLIDTIAELSWVFEDGDIDRIMHSFFMSNYSIPEEDREILIWYYVLYNCEDFDDE